MTVCLYTAAPCRVYRPSDKDRLKLIWEELSAAHAHERTVKGRLLNAMFSGYAVGIAGIVAYLPGAQAGKLAPRNIGALQEFYITELKPETRTVVLADPGVWANRHKLKRDTRWSKSTVVFASIEININVNSLEVKNKALSFHTLA